MCVHLPLSHVRLFATPWTVALQAPLCMGFSKQEYWRWVACSLPGDLPDPGIKPRSLASPSDWRVDSLPLCHLGKWLSMCVRVCVCVCLCVCVYSILFLYGA